MLRNSNSRSSLFSQPRLNMRPAKPDMLQICLTVQDSLNEASKLLSHSQFSENFEKIVKNLIVRAEVQSPNSQAICLVSIKELLSLYGGSLQVNVRTLLLEILSDLSTNSFKEAPKKFQKAKHLVLQTKIDYLLSKIFLLEEKYFLLMHDEKNALKCLKKCFQMEENIIQFIHEEEEIRKQIVDNAIVANYEYYKVVKNDLPQQALSRLHKAWNTTKKTYGKQNTMAQGLASLYQKQQNYINTMEKASTKSRAITDILDYQNSKQYNTVAFYSWEDEKIVVQLIKKKGNEKQIWSEVSHPIKLNMNDIRALKSNEWIIIEKDGNIIINEEELLRLLGVTKNNHQNQSHDKQMTTADIIVLPRHEVIGKNILSSDDDEEDIFSRTNLPMFKNNPRSQSSRRFKQTQ